MIYEIRISSKKPFEVIDINHDVADAVAKSGVQEGICLIYIPHATAAVFVNENADPNIGDDFLKGLDKAIPLHAEYKHDEIDNNAAAHIKAGIVGPSDTLIIHQGKLVLGTWQDIMVADFDGPKQRRVLVKVIGSER